MRTGVKILREITFPAQLFTATVTTALFLAWDAWDRTAYNQGQDQPALATGAIVRVRQTPGDGAQTLLRARYLDGPLVSDVALGGVGLTAFDVQGVAYSVDQLGQTEDWYRIGLDTGEYFHGLTRYVGLRVDHDRTVGNFGPVTVWLLGL